MTSKELVKRAIRFEYPDRIPIYLFNKDWDRSDIVSVNIGYSSDFKPREKGDTEWGFIWEQIDNTMGQPKDHVIKDWGMLDDFKQPSAGDPNRYKHIESFSNKYSDKYKIFTFGITGFNLVTFLRGFENTLLDFYENRENIIRLIDIVFDYEYDVIKNLYRYDIDAVAFYDDWGTQNSLMINPDLWREIFKGRYKKQFDLVHDIGKDVYFHSCGDVSTIIDDLIHAGVDVLNFNQPEVHGLNELSRYSQRVCFNCPVDLQKKAIKGSKEEIYAYTKELIQKLSTEKGGFIGYVEEYSSIGL